MEHYGGVGYEMKHSYGEMAQDTLALSNEYKIHTV